MAIVNVRNRNNGTTGYTLDDGGLTRQFMPGETKKIDEDELRRLYLQPGGRYILENYLIIQDEALVSDIVGAVEPEYNYTEDQIKELLLNGTEDELRDCLDFAPQGVKELVKQLAVDMRLNDMRKRRIIGDHFGFDINAAIGFKEEDEGVDPVVEETPKRRVAAPTQARRVIITNNKK